MKKLLLILAIASCGREPNRAAIMVQAQAAKAQCVTAKLGTTEVAKCQVPAKDKFVPFISVYDTTLAQPFQVYPLEQQEKKDAPTPPPAPPAPAPSGEGSGAAAPPAETGSGSAK